MARRSRRNRRRRRGRFAFLYRLLCFVLICAAIVGALVLFFKVDTISVSGNDRYSRETILAASGVSEGDNLFLLNKYDAAARITAPSLEAAMPFSAPSPGVSSWTKTAFERSACSPFMLRSIQVDCSPVYSR